MPIRLTPKTTVGSVYAIESQGWASSLSMEEDDMTLILAGCGTDGVVMLTDLRETTLQSLWYLDHAAKQQRVSDSVLVGFAGSGLIARDRLTRVASRITANASVTRIARLVKRSMPDDSFKRVGWVFLGCQPAPTLVAPHGGDGPLTVYWDSSARKARQWYVLGIPDVAVPLMAMLWKPNFTVREVAAAFVVVHYLVSSTNKVVSPRYTLDVLRSDGVPWTSQDASDSVTRANQYIQHWQAIRP